MAAPLDPRHLQGLLGTAGKRLAYQPQGREAVARVRAAHSPRELRALLEGYDLGLDPPARDAIIGAAGDASRWEEVHATLVRAAEQSLAERFDSGA